MIHRYLVTVETDDAHLDAPNAQQIANEIQSNLEYGGHTSGIVAVSVESFARPVLQAFVQPHSEGGDV